MNQTVIEAWLRRRLQSSILGCWLGALGALLLGLLVLFFTFWFTYAVLFILQMGVSAIVSIILNHGFRLTHEWRLILSGTFVALLFVEWFRRSKFELGHYESCRTGSGSSAFVLNAGLGGGIAMILANPQGAATIVTEILYTGPRLIIGALRLGRAGHRLKQVEVPSCAWALEQLAHRSSRITLSELVQAWPEVDWQRLELDFAMIPGTVRLEDGLSVTRELRDELLGLMSLNPSAVVQTPRENR